MSEFARFVQRCVAQVWGDGAFRGSGFFVAPNRLVTCAHVVRSAAVSVVFGGREVPATVRLRVPAEPGAGEYYPLPDVAVLDLAEPVDHEVVWFGDAVPANGDLVEVCGFVADTPSGVGGHVARLRVAGPSSDYLRLAGDWVPPGLSGAPVVDETTRRVCGMVKASRDRHASEGGWIVPVAELARLPEVGVEDNRAVRGGWWTLATRRAEMARALFGPPDARGLPRAPSAWLDPRRGVIEFQPRPEFDALAAWVLDPAAPSVRLVYGPGGIGKTRLAVELSARLTEKGWITGLLPKSGDLSPLLRGSPPDVLRHDEVFIAVDYAESRVEPLLQLFDSIARFGGPHVRVLLLSRAAGQWWRDLPSRETEGMFVPEPLRLSNLVETFDARDLVRAAYQGFREPILGGDGPVPDAVLGSVDGHETVLSLHVLALGAVLYERGHGQAPAAGEAVLSDPLRGLLHHEVEVWTGVAGRRGLLDGVPEEVARQVLLVPTLVPARDAEQARAALAAIPGLAHRDADEVRRVADLLAEVYPGTRPETTRFWDSLQPDRLGETLLADLLGADGFADAVSRMTALLDADQAVQPVTVVARTAGLFTPQPNALLEPALELLELLLSENPAAFLPAVVAVATSLPDPQKLCGLAEDALEEVDLDVLHRTAQHFLLSQTVMSELAAQVWGNIAGHTARRGLFQAQNQIAFIDAQNNIAFFLSNTDLIDDAIEAGENALKMARMLATAIPAVMDPKLASICTTLARCYAVACRMDKAVEAAEAAVVANRSAAERDPAGNTISLAGALNNLAAMQAEVGALRPAALTARDAIGCFLELVRRDPDVHRIELESALRNLHDIVHADQAPVVAAEAWAAAEAELHALGQSDTDRGTVPAHWSELPGGKRHMTPHLPQAAQTGLDAVVETLLASNKRNLELMNAAVRVLIPVGHSVGSLPAFDEEEVMQGVRVGDDVLDLDYREYAMWVMVTDMRNTEGRPPTRRTIEQLAEEIGMDEPSRAMDTLLNDRLVVEVPTRGPSAERFARTHRVSPLAWGYGVDMAAGGGCQIGHPTSAGRVYLGLPTYLVWAMSPAYPDLWTAVVRVSEDFVAEMPDEVEFLRDPASLLGYFLLSIPLLVGQAVAYVDRVVT